MTYTGRASRADIKFQSQLTINAISGGFIEANNTAGFKGIVLDKDGLRLTDGSLGFPSGDVTEQEIKNNTKTEQPCGYK